MSLPPSAGRAALWVLGTPPGMRSAQPATPRSRLRSCACFARSCAPQRCQRIFPAALCSRCMCLCHLRLRPSEGGQPRLCRKFLAALQPELLGGDKIWVVAKVKTPWRKWKYSQQLFELQNSYSVLSSIFLPACQLWAPWDLNRDPRV